ncbi:hypothetical protein CTAYLR_008341, partial [Chrysophaeum taylorii]
MPNNDVGSLVEVVVDGCWRCVGRVLCAEPLVVETRRGTVVASDWSPLGTHLRNFRQQDVPGRPVAPGVVGLSNLGNTCFLNAVLQCVLALPPIESPRNDPSVSRALSELREAVGRGGHVSLAPTGLKAALAARYPCYEGTARHDAIDLALNLFSALHDEANEVQSGERTSTAAYHRDCFGSVLASAWCRGPPEQSADSAKCKLRERHASPILDEFGSQLWINARCSSCGRVHDWFPHVLYLSFVLPVPSHKIALARGCATCGGGGGGKLCSRCRRVAYCSTSCQRRAWTGSHRDECRPPPRLDLAALLDDKFRPSLAELPHRPCDACGAPLAVFEARIWRAPRVLLLHLDRNHKVYGKTETRVEAPVTGWNLGRWVHGPEAEAAVYDLRGVVDHTTDAWNDAFSGHFSARFRNPRDAIWYRACDVDAAPAPPEMGNATLLFYEKQQRTENLRGVIEAVADGLVSRLAVPEVALSSGALRYAATRRAVRENRESSSQCVERLVAETMRGDEAAFACCRSLLDSGLVRRAIARLATPAVRSVAAVARLVRCAGDGALAPLALDLALRSVTTDSFPHAAKCLVPAACAAAALLDDDDDASSRSAADAFCEIAGSSVIEERRELALGALVAGRSVFFPNPGDWEDRLLGVARRAIVVRPDSSKLARRYAARLVQHARGDDAAWGDWLAAYATAEFETSLHLFAPALDTLVRLLSGGRTPPTEWILALARRLLANDNPAVRKAAVSRLLGLPLLLPWDFVRDDLLPALDDAELRKGKDFAKDLDAAAEAFCAALFSATNAPKEDVCKFACSRACVCADSRLGAAGRDALLSVFRRHRRQDERLPPLDSSDVRRAAEALGELRAAANRATTVRVAEALATILRATTTVDLDAAAAFAEVASRFLTADDLGPWLARVANSDDWARYSRTANPDSAGGVLASLASVSDYDCSRVVRAFVDARGPEFLVLCCSTERAAAAAREPRARLWRALDASDAERLDSLTRDQMNTPENFRAAADLRELVNALALDDDSSPASREWRRRAADLAASAGADLAASARADLAAAPNATTLRALRCLRACAPFVSSERAADLASIARDATARRDSKEWRAVDRERWALTAALVARHRRVEVDAVETTDALRRCGSDVASVVDMLRCALAAARRVGDKDDDVAALVDAASAAARDASRAGSPRLARAISRYVFAPACARALAQPLPALSRALLRLARGLLDLAEAKRPHILRAVALAFAAACREASSSSSRTRGGASGSPAAAFAPLLTRLLLTREHALKPAETPDDDDDDETEEEKSVARNETTTPAVEAFGRVSRARLCALLVLENDGGGGALASLRRAVCLDLLRLDVELRECGGEVAAARRSAAWGKRLRAWQALCVLAPNVDLVENDDLDFLSRSLPSALVSPCLPCVRYAVETASVAFAKRWPARILPHIFDRLDVVRDDDDHDKGQGGRELALASLLVVAGHVVVDYSDDDEPSPFAPQLLRAALAFQGSTRGLVRGIAQLLVLALCPGGRAPDPPDDASYVAATVAALKRDPDVARHVERQRRFFWTLRAPALCTVRGMIEAGTPVEGDVVGESIVATFKKRIADTAREIARLDETRGYGQVLWKAAGASRKNDSDVPAFVVDHKSLFIQRKIDQLMAETTTWEDDDDDESRARRATNPTARLNVVGNERMRVVVCASLVDKTPNLAGLVRTAEVFAAEAVVVPDLNLTKTLAFRAVAVTADKWIRIDECHPRRLLAWLHEKRRAPPSCVVPLNLSFRREGYAIVALEQASGSKSLAEAVLPTPAVLLLGREKEGLDVDLLQAVDMCVEIPQLGVVRSLNVHVSGACP